MKTTFYPSGVCSKKYDIEIENGIIKDIEITGGCNGNLRGIRALITGKKAEDIIPLLKGTPCGNRPTSCPDQISIALDEALKAEAQARAASEKAFSSSMDFNMEKEFIYANYPSVRNDIDSVCGVSSSADVSIAPVYFDELCYLLMQSGTHMILFGGTWNSDTQAVMGKVNFLARKYGVESVYNYDFRIDGETVGSNIKSDLTEQESYDGPGKKQAVAAAECNILYGELVSRYFSNLKKFVSEKPGITYLNIEYDPVTVPDIREPFLFLYNKDNAQGPIVAGMELTAKSTLEEIEQGVFTAVGKNGNNITPFTHQDYLYQAFKINGRGHSIKTEDCFKEGEQINLCPVTMQEARWILSQKGSFLTYFCGAWCANSQAGIATVNDFAVANNCRVYMLDVRLEGKHQIDFWNYPRRCELRFTHPAVRKAYLDLWERCLAGAQILQSVTAGQAYHPYVTDEEGNEHAVLGIDIPYLVASNRDIMSKTWRGSVRKPVLASCNHDGFELINCAKSFIYYEPNYRKYTAGVYYVFWKYKDSLGEEVHNITIDRTAPLVPGEVHRNENVSGKKIEPKVHNWWKERGVEAPAGTPKQNPVPAAEEQYDDCC